MKNIHKTAILAYSAEKMYALVADIESYPEFLPWCSKTVVEHDEAGQTVLATLYIDFHGLKQHFTTRNVNHPSQLITMKLENGPFEHLDGRWTFVPLAENRSRIEFSLHYEFSSTLFENLSVPVFDMVSSTMVDSFRLRAKKVYG